MMNFKIVAGEKETAEKLLDNIKSFILSEMNQAETNTEYQTLDNVLEYLNQISVEE